ncbi:GNAT family N-acetyltransferase [Kribbella italica]|uniref:RimJ/RimL family protein N-acetyltransferase n=1 Tax=Kribbella italica TaxID=1540520 RepID=A0A7W9J419_9ACTN|nr:GNAT family protein [Kribbella italica]MBB5835133.1 RimJ/RimL family protein N-acetyltransferase [Kribbella italica]
MSSVWVGERVRLRAIEPEDWADFQRFDQDSELQRNVDMVHAPRSAVAMQAWAEEQATLGEKDDRLQLAIEAIETDTVVGACSTNDTSRRCGRFSYGIAIGREHHRHGYASDAVKVLLRFMFEERRYHKAEAGVYAYNDASIALQERLGFQREGQLRDHEFLAGAYQDLIIYGMTAEEFAALHIRK